MTQHAPSNDYPVTITGRHMEVTPALKEHVLEKLHKIDKFHHRVTGVQARLETQKGEHRIEITVEIDHVKLVAHAVTPDMYASIDEAVHKLDHQIRRYKEKLQQ